ncbi:MAG: metal dependent phosphohydrolase [Herminiimonas sp.]|nr:metal dependent phosphohydrolase [Herminiimonas sp.]
MGTVDDLLRRLDQLNEVGAALSNERDIKRLLEKILIAAQKITQADGGTLYSMTEDKSSLQFEILRNTSLAIALGGTSDKPIPFAALPLTTEDGLPNTSMIAAYCAIHRKTVNIPDAYEAKGFDFSGTRRFDEGIGYRSKSFLTVPMKNHEDEIIGVLQLINAIDADTNQVVPFSAAAQRLAESLASQAAIALSNRQLILQQEALFESFIGMINFAIDDKSPYTGGHCQRVPALTMMLAEAVEETTEGPFASFSMTEQDRYELKIAGLLHDCGKITTPVHVVDKETKLQTIFDRIDLVDTRFEVLKRDAEIAMLEARLALRAAENPAAEKALESGFRQQVEQLDSEREFLRRANIGSEAMRSEDQQAVRDIGASHRWINPQGETVNFLTDNETENLVIRAGTLTPSEREIINNHIVVTIKMLESLPWVKHLKRVPEYAGGHHERMDGKGYPRGLTRDQMSVQARIMGIADIFEALTAKDRPYKPGKTLSESLSILAKLNRNGHIDPDLFNIFVRSKVYLKYGLEFLDPEQIDEVDESKVIEFAAGSDKPHNNS